MCKLVAGVLSVPILLFLSACGGGGSRAVTTGLTVHASGEQPFDGKTVLAWSLEEQFSQLARFWLEYQVGDEPPMRVSDAHVYGYDFANKRVGDPMPFQDPDGMQWIGDARVGGTRYEVVWDHEAELGQREVRDVSVRIVYGGASADDAMLSAPTDLWVSHASIGRETGMVTDLALSREDMGPGGNESDVVVTATLTDQAGDHGELTLEYAVGAGPGGGLEWHAARTEVMRTHRGGPPAPHDPMVFDVRLAFDPIAEGIPFAGYDMFWLRVGNREMFGERSRFPTVTPPARMHSEPSAFMTTIGTPPDIGDPSMPDPATSVGDPRRPWLGLPIRFDIANRSRKPGRVRVRIRGEYRVDDGPAMPMKFADGDAELTLEPGEQRAHHVTWDTVSNVGFGIPLDAQGRANAVATIWAEIADNPEGTMPVRSQAASTDSSRLMTIPFAEFRENLVPDSRWLHRDAEIGQPATRNLFYTKATEPGEAGLGHVVGVDQQFAAMAMPGLLPGDGEVDLRTGPPNPRDRSSAPIETIQPVDVDPGPDCIVETADGLYHVAWPPDGKFPELARGQPRVRKLLDPAANPIRYPPDTTADMLWMPSVPIMVGDRPGSFLMKNLVPYIGDQAGDCLTIFANVVWRTGDDPDSPWMHMTSPLPGPAPMLPQAVPLIRYYGFGGEFDGNPMTHDYLVASTGIGTSMPGMRRRGFFDIVTHRMIDGAPAISPMGMQLMMPMPVDMMRPMARLDGWIFGPMPNHARPHMPDVLLVRSVEDMSQPPRAVVTVDVMRQRESEEGGLVGQYWRRLARLVAGRDMYPFILPANARLEQAQAADLGGNDASEIVLTFSSGRRIVVIVCSTRVDGSPVWNKFLSTLPASGYEFDFDRTQLIDVDGDDCLDLLVHEQRIGDPNDARWWSYPSTRSSVAGGRSMLAGSAAYAASRGPAVADIDRDGFADVVSGGGIHYGRADGAFEAGSVALAGGRDSTYVVERVFEGADPDTVEIVSYSPYGPSVIERLENVRERDAIEHTTPATIDVGGAMLQAVRPFSTGDGGPAKDLAAIVGGRLTRLRLLGGAFVPDPYPWISSPVDLLVVVRRGALEPDADPTMNHLAQDVVVAMRGSRILTVLQADPEHPGTYDRRELIMPAPIEALACAAVSSDAVEDLVVLTGDAAGTQRVHCIAASPERGVADPLFVDAFMQFAPEYMGAPVALEFARWSHDRAQGVVIEGGQLRFVMPVGDRESAIGTRMVRSTIPMLPGQSMISLTDIDRDGQLEVIGSTIGPNGPELFKIDRGYRRQ